MRDFNSGAFLENLVNDRNLAREILAIYLDSSRALLDKLESSIEAGDASEIALHSHSLKGASLNVGAERMADIARQSEQAAKEGFLDPAADLLAQLRSAYQDFLRAVKEEGWSH